MEGKPPKVSDEEFAIVQRMASLQRDIRSYYANFKNGAVATTAAVFVGIKTCSPEYDHSTPAAAGLVATLAFLYSASQMIFAGRAEGEREQLNQKLQKLKSLDDVVDQQ